MSLLAHPPLHDFPDRAFRWLLEDPGNLRDLIAVVLPHHVDRLDFTRVEILPRTFLMDDWRRRELGYPLSSVLAAQYDRRRAPVRLPANRAPERCRPGDAAAHLTLRRPALAE